MSILGITATAGNAAKVDKLNFVTLTNVDKIIGGTAGDRITGDSSANDLDGGKGDDRLSGVAGANTIRGGSGRDFIVGGSDADVLLDGGAGDDEILAGPGDDQNVSGGTGNDELFGDAGNDKLFGNDGKDTLIGGTGDDELAGGKGNDNYEFGPAAWGSDIVSENSGEGFDTLDFSKTAANLTFNLSGDAVERFRVEASDGSVARASNRIERIVGGSGINSYNVTRDFFDSFAVDNLFNSTLVIDNQIVAGSPPNAILDLSSAPAGVTVTISKGATASQNKVTVALSSGRFSFTKQVVFSNIARIVGPRSGGTSNDDFRVVFEEGGLLEELDWINAFGVLEFKGSATATNGTISASDQSVVDLATGEFQNFKASNWTVDGYKLSVDGSGYGLTLKTVTDVSQIASTGNSQVHVAQLNGSLYFRVFDSQGNLLVDSSEADLDVKSSQLQEFKDNLFALSKINPAIVGNPLGPATFSELEQYLDSLNGAEKESLEQTIISLTVPLLGILLPSDGFASNESVVANKSRQIVTGTNNDLVIGGHSTADQISTGSGEDLVLGFGGNDQIDVGSGIDYVDGGSGDDTIRGGKGADILFGGDGNDDVRGEGGADRIIGGRGNDTLKGGDKGNTFVFEDGWGQDKILSDRFGGGQDTLDFTAVTAPLTYSIEDARIHAGTGEFARTESTRLGQSYETARGDFVAASNPNTVLTETPANSTTLGLFARIRSIRFKPAPETKHSYSDRYGAARV